MSPNCNLEVLEKSLCDKEVWQANKIKIMEQGRRAEQVTSWVKQAYKEKRQDLQSTGGVFKWCSNGRGTYPGRGGTWTKHEIETEEWFFNSLESDAHKKLHDFFLDLRIDRQNSEPDENHSYSDKAIFDLAMEINSCLLITLNMAIILQIVLQAKRGNLI